MLNPNKKIAKSEGVDLPLMRVYLVGRISGNCIDKCTAWRKQIINHYSKYRPIVNDEKQIVDYEAYPIAFISPLNSGESKTADSLGLKSHIPPGLIFDKDMLSLNSADIIVANLDDFMEYGIEDLMDEIYKGVGMDYQSAFERLKKVIQTRRPNYGSMYEISIAMHLGKPVILIAGNEHSKYICENHPFLRRASVVVKDVDTLLKEKWLQTLYKSMAGSIGE